MKSGDKVRCLQNIALKGYTKGDILLVFAVRDGWVYFTKCQYVDNAGVSQHCFEVVSD